MKRMLFLIVMMLFSCAGMLAASEDAHRGYDSQNGPEHWGALAKKFDMCAKELNQLPVDLVAGLPANLPEIVFEYNSPGNFVEENTDHAIQENMNPGNHVIYLGKRYELKQFHFHSPSKHTLNGKTFAMRVHLVHQNDENDYLVIGLLFEAGKHNKILNELPSFKKSRGEDPLSNLIDFHYLITDSKDYFLYNALPTTPPCTERVRWIVLKQPIIASSEQIQHYYDLLGFDNNRPIQPHNSRIILE